MKIAIHQPDYIPYLGYFYKISQVEKFVFLDDCQFSNDNWHHWNRIKSPQGECRMKVPVEQHFGDTINTVRTRDELKWKEKHLKTITMNYAKAPYFHEIFPVFEEKLMQNYACLADMNIAINTWIARGFGLCAEFFRTSEMAINTFKEERVIDVCIMLGGDTYISGTGAAVYEVEEHFNKRGVQLVYTDYKPIQYKQQWDKRIGFLPYMSVLDYLFNCGFDWERVEDAVKMQHKQMNEE